MFACERCGAVAPSDNSSGYDGDPLCPVCIEETQQAEAVDIDRLHEDEAYERWVERKEND